jgi:hypothetical protein
VSGSLGDGLSAMGGSDAGDTGALRLSPVIHRRRLHCTHALIYSIQLSQYMCADGSREAFDRSFFQQTVQ